MTERKFYYGFSMYRNPSLLDHFKPQASPVLWPQSLNQCLHLNTFAGFFLFLAGILSLKLNASSNFCSCKTHRSHPKVPPSISWLSAHWFLGGLLARAFLAGLPGLPGKALASNTRLCRTQDSVGHKTDDKREIKKKPRTRTETEILTSQLF